MKKETYTGGEIAQLLKLPRRTATHYLQKGVIPSTQHPLTGAYTVQRDDLIAFMKAHGLDVEALEPKPRLLIVDDEPTVIRFAERALEKSGLEVEASSLSNGYEAMIAIGESTPDIIVLDVQMPLMDGREVLKAIRKGEKTKGIRVLAITGFPQFLDEMKALGADEALAKPFDAEMFIDALRRLLADKRGTARARR